MAIDLNYRGMAHARELIAHGKTSNGPWKFGEEDAAAMKGPNGTDLGEHEKHHLGIDHEHPWGNPARTRYPFAKEGKIYSRALHGIRNEAHDNGHHEISHAASMLLGEMKSRENPSERHIVHDGGKWKLYTKDGSKLISVHDTKEGAVAQEAAIKAHEADEGRTVGPLAIEVRSIARAEVRVTRKANGEPKIEGYAAVFNSRSQDLGGFTEELDPAAFDEVLGRETDVRGLFNHDPNQVLGRTLSGTMRLGKDSGGLHYEISPPKSREDIVESLERGDINGSSFSFTTHPGEQGERWDRSGPIPHRTVMGVRELYDVGPVTYPAYLDTTAATRSLSLFQVAAPGRADSRIRLRMLSVRARNPIFLRG